MIVEVRPDLFARQQMARWILAAFEVLLVTGLVAVVGGWLGAEAGAEVSQVIRLDVFAGIALVAVLGWIGTIGGAYLTLRYLAGRK